MKALSLDLRHRIAQAYNDQEGSIRQLARRFKVSKSSVERLIQAERATGSLAPKPHGGGRRPIVRIEDKACIKALLKQNCDLSQEQIAERFTEQTGRSVSQQAISRALKRLSITKKKSMTPQEQQRDGVQAERRVFIDWMKTVDPARVKGVDESGLVRGMRLSYGYSERGERCFDTAPLSRGKRLSLVGWIGLDGSGCVATQPGTINQPLFRGFILKHLLPRLGPGDFVVWDNHRIHDAERLKQQIEARGARVVPLPRYSPDLSPIEPMWSKTKHVVRKLRADTAEALEQAVEVAVSLVRGDDARGWFAHCGFCHQPN